MIRLSGKKSGILDLLFFLLGGCLCSLAVNMFTSPNNIAPGGLTGVGIVLRYLFHTPVGAVNMLLNVPIFIWAFIEIGYKLVGKSLLAVVLCSCFIDLGSLFIPAYQGDMLLAAVFGGGLEGLGLAMFLMRGSTTGGTDLVARLLSHRHRHLSVGKLLMGIDVLVVVFSMVAYQSPESALYAVIAIFVSTHMIDSVLYGTSNGNGKLYFILSEKYKEISRKILEDLDRGVTLIPDKGGYSGRPGEMILCAVRRFEVTRINEIIYREDPDAFVIVGEAGEITGEGFHPSRSDDTTLRQLIEKLRKKEG